MHPYFHIFNFQIPAFGTMIAIGVLCFALLTLHLFKRHKISEATVDKLIVILAVSGAMFAIGAHFFDSLWHNLEEWKIHNYFYWDWWGITYSGGLFSAILCYLLIYSLMMRYERHLVFDRLDLVVIGICFAHGFGRIGCFLGGCCYGKVVPEGTFTAVYYPMNDAGTIHEWVLPTQLYESVFLFILAFVLLFAIKKNRSAWYLIIYNVFRFFLEYFRGDDRGASPFGILTPSQFMSIVMFIWGIVLLFFRKKIEAWLFKKNKQLVLATEEENGSIENNSDENISSVTEEGNNNE